MSLTFTKWQCNTNTVTLQQRSEQGIMLSCLPGRRRVCPKNRRRKCYYYKSCYKRRRFCVCVKRRYGDETKYDNQVDDEVNDETADEDEDEELEETSKTNEIVWLTDKENKLKNKIKCFLHSILDDREKSRNYLKYYCRKKSNHR